MIYDTPYGRRLTELDGPEAAAALLEAMGGGPLAAEAVEQIILELNEADVVLCRDEATPVRADYAQRLSGAPLAALPTEIPAGPSVLDELKALWARTEPARWQISATSKWVCTAFPPSRWLLFVGSFLAGASPSLVEQQQRAILSAGPTGRRSARSDAHENGASDV